MALIDVTLYMSNMGEDVSDEEATAWLDYALRRLSSAFQRHKVIMSMNRTMGARTSIVVVAPNPNSPDVEELEGEVRLCLDYAWGDWCRGAQ